MGSLASRPKVPSTPQVVYVPQAVTPAPVAKSSYTPANNAASETTSDASAASQTTEEKVSEARTENLLQRSRGRYGTITTGFRGLLNAATSSGRKTLLGE